MEDLAPLHIACGVQDLKAKPERGGGSTSSQHTDEARREPHVSPCSPPLLLPAIKLFSEIVAHMSWPLLPTKHCTIASYVDTSLSSSLGSKHRHTGDEAASCECPFFQQLDTSRQNLHVTTVVRHIPGERRDHRP